MAYIHTSVNETSEKYRQNEKRYNYTTPKNFLEQITLYKNLLGRKRQELSQKMERLANGIEKLKPTESQLLCTNLNIATVYDIHGNVFLFFVI